MAGTGRQEKSVATYSLLLSKKNVLAEQTASYSREPYTCSYLRPELSTLDFKHLFATYGLPTLLGIIMFGIGITLKAEDFKRVVVKPKEILVALLGQVILLPLTAFLIASIFNFPLWAKIGLILVAACPAGASPNVITHYLKGRLALAVSTTALSSVLVLVTIPLIVNLALSFFGNQEREISLPAGQTILKICLTVLLPIIGGVLLKEFKGSLAGQLEKIMKWVMPLVLLSIFGGSLYLESGGDVDISKYLNQYPYAIALNLGAMLLSFLTARFLLPDKQSHYTISAIVGIQNNALAIYIANSLLQKPELAVMPIIYSSFTFFSTTLFSYAAKKLEE